jgi:hypothetical protein
MLFLDGLSRKLITVFFVFFFFREEKNLIDFLVTLFLLAHELISQKKTKTRKKGQIKIYI